jgi:hypothetical protein
MLFECRDIWPLHIYKTKMIKRSKEIWMVAYFLSKSAHVESNSTGSPSS